MKKYKLSKGILIAIEGIDGAGKTTQINRLRDHFKRIGFPTVKFKEPTEGIYGQQIRELARHGRHTVTPKQEFELFLKDRIEDCELNIRPALEAKKLVFLDRYYFSNIAYQSVLGMDKEYIRIQNEEVAVIPDLVMIFDVAPIIGLSRIKNLRKEEHNHFEREDYLDKVRKVFLELDYPYVQVVDSSQDEDTIFNHIKNITQDIILPYATVDDNQIDLFTIKQNSPLKVHNSN